MSDTDLTIARHYFDAFNAGDAEAMLNLISEDVQHFVNQGDVRHGKDAFRAFLAEMDRAYSEHISDLTLFDGPPGRVAAEFTIDGTYKATQPSLPAATGQRYSLPVGSFLSITSGQITRVTTYYNLADWLRQVSE
ncbi:ketosteroid isomerase-related protein [Palleronia caenipelagi]|uniref:Isopropylmalate/homocitrate/citramalate synthase n=1 Tax=Palleronia caenipelagi TaxID=2489174 RepID=A0A547Q8B0_9RHOB|nr:ketosteroid isomerase-related protein [Palleronia caenipelagi]TRD22616.1 isopropylmalate/homocitrate/citramalate synthase [Palleronia caenipelagi]